jgi:hypothetical protein
VQLVTGQEQIAVRLIWARKALDNAPENHARNKYFLRSMVQSGLALIGSSPGEADAAMMR